MAHCGCIMALHMEEIRENRIKVARLQLVEKTVAACPLSFRLLSRTQENGGAFAD